MRQAHLVFPAADQEQFVEVQERVGQQGLAPQGLDLGGQVQCRLPGLGVALVQGGFDFRGLLCELAVCPLEIFLTMGIVIAKCGHQVFDTELQSLSIGLCQGFGRAGGQNCTRR